MYLGKKMTEFDLELTGQLTINTTYPALQHLQHYALSHLPALIINQMDTLQKGSICEYNQKILLISGTIIHPANKADIMKKKLK
jgi:hypothetical protein